MPLVASAIRGRGGFPNLPEEHMTVPRKSTNLADGEAVPKAKAGSLPS